MRKQITLATVRADLKEVGVTIRKNRYDEYRVNIADGSESTAYYTEDLDDAWNTGLDMAAWQIRQQGKLAALLCTGQIERKIRK